MEGRLLGVSPLPQKQIPGYAHAVSMRGSESEWVVTNKLTEVSRQGIEWRMDDTYTASLQ